MPPWLKSSFADTGNRCGHDPANPLDVFFATEARRPPVLQWGMANIRTFFFKPKKFLRDLTTLNRLKKRGGHRLNRSEGRESLMAMGLFLFNHLELATMTVRFDDVYFGSPTLAKLIQNGKDLSFSRAKRALHKLVKVGYVKVTRQYDKKNDIFRALASIKEITPKFFIGLGLGKYYHFQKHYKQNKLAKKGLKQKINEGFKKSDTYVDSLFSTATEGGRKLSQGEAAAKPVVYSTMTPEAQKALRDEYIALAREMAPTVPLELIESTVMRQSVEQIKRYLDHHKAFNATHDLNNKSPPVPP